jgi:cyclophilin family peptidyl-prolyl cis-trans isomerase
VKSIRRPVGFGLPLLLLALVVVLAAGPAASQEETEAMDKSAEKVDFKDPDLRAVLVLTHGEEPLGEITLRFYPEAAPKAVENFVGLAAKGYYDGVIFHRVIKDFMMQGGDPTGTGYGGKSLWGEPFDDEVSEEHTFDQRGLLAMANAGPKTNGSQFFITFKPTPWLNGKHTIFGEVVGGPEVVDAVEAAETGPRDKPVLDITIQSIRFEKAEG